MKTVQIGDLVLVKSWEKCKAKGKLSGQAEGHYIFPSGCGLEERTHRGIAGRFLRVVCLRAGGGRVGVTRIDGGTAWGSYRNVSLDRRCLKLVHRTPVV